MVIDRFDLDSILEDWARERPDLDMSPVRLTLLLRRTFEAVDRKRNALLSEYGLSTSAIDLLSVLRRGGEPYRNTPTALAELMMITAGGVTQRIQRLVEAKLIRRSVDSSDRRVNYVELTKRGLELVDGVLPLYMEQEHRMLSALGDKERNSLERLLSKILDSVDSE